MNIVRTIKMSKAEHDVIRRFYNLVTSDEELNSYDFDDIFNDVLASNNMSRKIFNIEYTDEE